MLERLPHWHATGRHPAFMETESLTALEMTSRVYGKMNELVDDYNKFVDNVNAHIDAFEESAEKNYNAFTIAIRQEFQDFIDVIELKLQAQDKEIADAVAYMKTNLIASVRAMYEEVIRENQVTLTANYYKNNEQLEFVLSQTGGNVEYLADTETLLFNVKGV